MSGTGSLAAVMVPSRPGAKRRMNGNRADVSDKVTQRGEMSRGGSVGGARCAVRESGRILRLHCDRKRLSPTNPGFFARGARLGLLCWIFRPRLVLRGDVL